jgi:hypothetical protein
MTMADLGLPPRTGPPRHVPAGSTARSKHAVIPPLASLLPGVEPAAGSPDAKPSRAQLLGDVPKQVLPVLKFDALRSYFMLL